MLLIKYVYRQAGLNLYDYTHHVQLATGVQIICMKVMLSHILTYNTVTVQKIVSVHK